MKSAEPVSKEYEMVKHTFSVKVEADHNFGEPWLEHDGHGVVSEWTSRKKRPGERVLCSKGGMRCYYDIKTSVKMARKDGWNTAPYEFKTKRAQAAASVEADFQHLKKWCSGEWWWCGVIVTLEIEEATYTDSLWGLCSDDDEGIDLAIEEIKDRLLDKATKRNGL